jgi:NADH:ubiquinone reductase (H+-translocating)
VPGVAEHGRGLKSLADALALRNHVLRCFEDADRAGLEQRAVAEGLLTFVVAGGGPTGVEVAGALVELIDVVLAREFHHIDVGRARVVLVEATGDLLGAFHPSLRRRALGVLRRRGVDVRLDVAIDRVEGERVHLAGGEVVPAATLIWSAGVRANPLGGALGVPLDRGGRVPVGDDLRLPGHPEVAVIGDLAAASDGEGGLLPQLAPVAMQQARYVADAIAVAVAGPHGPAPRQPFRYRDKGIMATIGRAEAVAQLPIGLRFGGFPGWLAWLGLHLLMLIGFRNRANVLVNWAWNYLTYDRGARLILEGGR